ncbi:MAG: CehA/McbA family metallohydrolase [Gemmataceae bacterium]|nr:CehA/McbA family metallohydrolase [Gemmataceae bacterium]
MTGPLHTVHVRINDAASGEPTPARVRFHGPSKEQYYAPFGRLQQPAPSDHSGGNLQLRGEQYAYIDGSCEVALPAHPVNVRITKGLEYRPIEREVTLGAGKLTLRLALERWIDLRQDGWYSGDTSVYLLSPHAALLEGGAEDVAVVNLLAAEWPPAGEARSAGAALHVPNILAFSGQRPILETPGHIVVVNTANNGAILGALDLLNAHRVVYPLSTGCRPDGIHSWTLADWCDQCHRKSGLVLWSGFGRRFSGDPDSPNDGYGGEVLADLILGKIDAVEMDWLDWQQHMQRDEWYRLLNCGFRVPLAGGSAKSTNVEALGGLRTYARLAPGQVFDYKTWIEAVRAGRTFVTNGPLLSFTLNGQDPGSELLLPAEARTVRVRAEARGIVPFERLELILNGEAVAAVEASGDPCTALLEGDFEVPSSGWLAARCWGTGPAFAAWHPERQHAAAHTSPIHVQREGKPIPPDLISLALLIERLDRMLSWVEKEARFVSDKPRRDLTETLQAARAELVRRAAPA